MTEVEQFIHNANTRIDRCLMDKLKLLGYDASNMRKAIDNQELKLKKALLVNTPEYVKEEYSANGILLFSVEWTETAVNILYPTIDEEDLPYIR